MLLIENWGKLLTIIDTRGQYFEKYCLILYNKNHKSDIMNRT